VFDKALRKSIEGHLDPGEELLDAMIVQGKGMTKMLAGGGVLGAAAVGAFRDRKGGDGEASDGQVTLASKMALAVTSRRLLIFKAGGAVTVKATELLTDLPLADVDSLEVGKGAMSKPVTLTVRGEGFRMEAPKASHPDKLVSAFEQAKGRSTAVR
jgi:hypothetical protein